MACFLMELVVARWSVLRRPQADTLCLQCPRTFYTDSLNFSLRHEVARLIGWHAVSTRPVVPSAVSYADVREGNDSYRACGHGTHSHPTGTGTARGRCICQHQAETGLDAWYGEHM